MIANETTLHKTTLSNSSSSQAILTICSSLLSAFGCMVFCLFELDVGGWFDILGYLKFIVIIISFFMYYITYKQHILTHSNLTSVKSHFRQSQTT